MYLQPQEKLSILLRQNDGIAMKQELPKNYHPLETDKKWYRFWEENRFFSADPHSSKEGFSIVIPPPNITGALHMGHALVNTLQDILVRWKRMQGYEAVWFPGTDHAGISTQTVVEKHLLKQEGKKRTDYEREEFLQHIWDWKEKNEDKILQQLKRMGCSCDWERKRFTMDSKNTLSVRHAFKILYDKGLIYKGDYLVNWDPVTQTAIADDEVEYEERSSSLWHIRYPITNGSGFVTIATTRPETLLGDTAVAVNPKDPRFSPLIGKHVKLPFVEREIPIIADRRVDPEFGTGMVKITPAHDPNDYQIGLDNDLPFVNIMTPDGRINENGAEFKGLFMEEARKRIVERLEEVDLLEKTEPHTHRVGLSYRSKAVIEPYMSKQWFVQMSSFRETMKEAVESKKIELIPENWENTYFHWINTLRDWCISRQLWWGHRIPIWYRKDNPDEMICHDGEGLPSEVEKAPNEWEQDPDVLDTWFSSSLWPFAVMGWPDETDDLKKFYPVSCLITGHDILFFWVARMIMMGKEMMGDYPFPKTYLHGLIYGKSYWRENPEGGITYVSPDERRAYETGETPPKDVKSKWEKMSKSKGNIIDPLEVIELYGTDAMRMALTASATQAREIDLDLRKFEEFKNFANKVWNGARFVLMNIDGDKENGLSPLTGEEFFHGIDHSLLSLEDRWILSKLNSVILTVNSHLEAFEFDQSALEAYNFFWKEFCAYYVEIVKPYLFGKRGSPEVRKNKQKVLLIVLVNAVRLLHPMAPFITEELFQLIKERFLFTESPDADPYTNDVVEALMKKGCIIAPYPKVVDEKEINPEIERTFSLVEQVVYTVRNIRGEMKIPPAEKIDLYLIGEERDENFAVIKEHIGIISTLIRSNQVEATSTEPRFPLSSTGMVDGTKILIPLPDHLLEKERKRLEKEKIKLSQQQERLEKQLSNTDFVEKAPKELIEKQQALLAHQKEELQTIEEKLSSLE